MFYNATACINTKNLHYNYQALCNYVKKPILSVVKANAYGLGVKDIFYTLYNAGCRAFAVAYYFEAQHLEELFFTLQLKEKIDIFLLSEFTLVKNRNNYEISKVNIIPIIYSIEHIHQFALNYDANIDFAIYFDTGFVRLGIDFNNAQEAYQLLQKYKIKAPKFIISHFANADLEQSNILFGYNKTQYSRFIALSRLFPNSLKSIANSNAIFLDRNYHVDFARPGKALYGLSPLAKSLIGVKNVFSLYAKVVQMQSIKEGDSVGYGQTFIAESEVIVATISAGYADGIPYQLSYSNKEKKTVYMHYCAISVKGIIYKAPIIGRVSMDTATLDITKIPKDVCLIGQEVEIFGENTLSLNEVADKIQSNVYSVLLNLGVRVKRKYLYDN